MSEHNWMQLDDELIDLSTFNNIYKVDPKPDENMELYYIVFVDTFNEQENEFKSFWTSKETRDKWFNAIFSHLSEHFINKFQS